MIPRYLALRERIHTELDALDQTQQAVTRIREELNRFADFLAALAQTDSGTINGG